MQGLQETYKKTPVMAQLEIKAPGEESFIHTRTASPPKATQQSMQRDPCNHAENFKQQHTEQDVLWCAGKNSSGRSSRLPAASMVHHCHATASAAAAAPPAPGVRRPSLQDRATQDSFKPPCSNIALGDERVCPFTTSYSTDFHAPFSNHGQLRSPMRNKDLAATQTSLKEHYASSYNRVGE